MLQGKGGVGKTITALLLAQCIADKGEPVTCIDTDPVNASFSNLSALPTERVAIFSEGHKVDTRALDQFTERLLSEDGASSFMPVSRYLIENDVVGELLEDGRLPVVHVVITGGPACWTPSRAWPRS